VAVKVLRAGNGGAASVWLFAGGASCVGGTEASADSHDAVRMLELTSSEGCAALSDEASSTQAQHA
jgi:hypothetical protein